jgi:ABC-type uncharacterized transport system substrate-binding protein
MRRRDFITIVGGAAATWSFAAQAQQPNQMRRIGVLLNFAPTDSEAQLRLATLQRKLSSLGWREGQDVQFEVRWGAGNVDWLRTLAKDLVASQPDVIVAHTTPATLAVARETRSIPIVFVNVADPIGDHFVASFVKPGGNITGFTNLEFSLGGKWLELLKKLEPATKRIALMFNPDVTPFAEHIVRSAKAAGPKLGLTPFATPVRHISEIENVISNLNRETDSGLVVFPDSFLAFNREKIVSLISSHRIVAIYPFKYWTETGGLVSYGSETSELYRNAAYYVDRILKGEKPADLPVQAPVKYELVINLKTAKALGLTVPPTLLASADEVIE